MNIKNIVLYGVAVFIIALVGGYYYFFVPSIAGDVSFNDVNNVSSSDDLSLDVDISSSTDMNSSSFTADDPIDQEISARNNIPPVFAVVSDNSENNSSSTITPIASCSFPDISSSALSRKIIFNEVAWMGSPSSSNAEWMEVKNISTDTINLSGWELLNRSGKISISFSSDDAIAADGMLLLSRNNSSTGISYSGNLSNAGDVLAIMNSQCVVSDILDASSGWPAGNNTTKQTMERDANNVGWHTSVSSGGTPGAENSAVVPPIPKISPSSSVSNSNVDSPNVEETQPTSTSIINSTSTDAVIATSSIVSSASSGHVLVAAVQIAGSSSTNDFVKLYNPTANSIDMSGWKLHKRSSTGTDYSLKSFPTGSVISAGQSFIWGNSTNGFSETIGANVSSTETLSADNSVGLLDANGNVIDALAWGTGTGQYGEGSPYPTDPANGQILTRELVNGLMVDTSNNANDFILQ
jgi:hypothetical protein